MSAVDQQALATSRLILQYKDAANLGKILSVFIGQIQDLEDAMQQFGVKRALNTATGAQLDGWGKILNAPRPSTDDSIYRIFLYSKIAEYFSEGRIEDIVSIFKVLMGASIVELREFSPATITIMAVAPHPIGDLTLIAESIRNAKAAGIKIGYLASAVEPAFAFLADPLGVTGGFGSTWQMNGVTGAGIFATIFGNPTTDQTDIPAIFEDFEVYPPYPATMLSNTDPNKFTRRNGEFDEGFYIEGSLSTHWLFVSSFTPFSAASWNRPELVGAQNYDVRLQMRTGGGAQGLGLLLRHSATGGYFLKFKHGQTVKLYKFSTWTPSLATLVAEGSAFSMTGLLGILTRVEGTKIKAWIVNATGTHEVMNATDADHAAGTVGLTSEFDYIEQHIDKIQVNKYL
jgi:hypothetical protein